MVFYPGDVICLLQYYHYEIPSHIGTATLAIPLLILVLLLAHFLTLAYPLTSMIIVGKFLERSLELVHDPR